MTKLFRSYGRHLAILEKIAVVKSIPKLMHLLSVLPNPTKVDIQQLTKEFFCVCEMVKQSMLVVTCYFRTLKRWTQINFDYCNSILSGIADNNVTKLRRLQNWLARVVMKLPPFTHCVPLLCSLHWSPVKFRVDFKDLSAGLQNRLFIFTPCLLHHSHQVHWDQTKESLLIPRVKTNKVWGFFRLVPFQNILPLSFRSATSTVIFRKRLKMHLFDLAFPPDTEMPDGLLMLRNCFVLFAVEHQFSCCATAPGSNGDIGAIEICFIYWLATNEFLSMSKIKSDSWLFFQRVHWIYSRSAIAMSFWTVLMKGSSR